MIRYSLKCKNGHLFESWFQNATAYDKLLNAGMITCEVCQSNEIEKAIMAPRVRPARAAAPSPAEPKSDESADLMSPTTETERAIAEIKKKIEEHSDYVGGNFADEARAIHMGEAPERSIYGEANAEDTKSLIDDGIAVAPLPFRPGRKSN